jgi:hypothetical protein
VKKVDPLLHAELIGTARLGVSPCKVHNPAVLYIKTRTFFSILSRFSSPIFKCENGEVPVRAEGVSLPFHATTMGDVLRKWWGLEMGSCLEGWRGRAFSKLKNKVESFIGMGGELASGRWDKREV